SSRSWASRMPWMCWRSSRLAIRRRPPARARSNASRLPRWPTATDSGSPLSDARYQYLNRSSGRCEHLCRAFAYVVGPWASALYGIATTSEEYNRMTLREHLLFAFTGWLAGVCIMLGVGFIIFPALVGTPHSFGAGPDRLILRLVVLLVSPVALLGGLVGGRLPKEGG